MTRATSTRGTPPCITPTKANAAWGLAGMSSSGTARRYAGKSTMASSGGISYLGFFLLKNTIGTEVSSFFEYSAVDSQDECIYLKDSVGRGMGPYDTYCSYDCKVICMCDGTASGESESTIGSLFSPLFTFHFFFQSTAGGPSGQTAPAPPPAAPAPTPGAGPATAPPLPTGEHRARGTTMGTEWRLSLGWPATRKPVQVGNPSLC